MGRAALGLGDHVAIAGVLGTGPALDIVDQLGGEDLGQRQAQPRGDPQGHALAGRRQAQDVVAEEAKARGGEGHAQGALAGPVGLGKEHQPPIDLHAGAVQAEQVLVLALVLAAVGAQGLTGEIGDQATDRRRGRGQVEPLGQRRGVLAIAVAAAIEANRRGTAPGRASGDGPARQGHGQGPGHLGGVHQAQAAPQAGQQEILGRHYQRPGGPKIRSSTSRTGSSR
ncbi:hypothetical protein GCM10008997_09590 [Halomonas salifodinae]